MGVTKAKPPLLSLHNVTFHSPPLPLADPSRFMYFPPIFSPGHILREGVKAEIKPRNQNLDEREEEEGFLLQYLPNIVTIAHISKLLHPCPREEENDSAQGWTESCIMSYDTRGPL